MYGCLLSGLCIQVPHLQKPSLWLTYDYYENVENMLMHRNNLIVLPFEIMFYNVFLEICVVST